MPGPSGGKGEKGDVGIAGLPGALVSYHLCLNSLQQILETLIE